MTCWADASGSFANRTRSSPYDSSSTRESLFASEFVPSQHRSGLSTSIRRRPTKNRSPRTGRRSGTPSERTEVRNARYGSERPSGGRHPESRTRLVGKRASTGRQAGEVVEVWVGGHH